MKLNHKTLYNNILSDSNNATCELNFIEFYVDIDLYWQKCGDISIIIHRQDILLSWEKLLIKTICPLCLHNELNLRHKSCTNKYVFCLVITFIEKPSKQSKLLDNGLTTSCVSDLDSCINIR